MLRKINQNKSRRSLEHWPCFASEIKNYYEDNLKSRLCDSGLYGYFTYNQECGTSAISNPIEIKLVMKDRTPLLRLKKQDPQKSASLSIHPSASLVFNISTDGGVLAIAYFFENPDREIKYGEHCVIGILPSATRVCGLWVKKVFEEFEKVAWLSHPSTTPTARTGKAIDRLFARSKRLTGQAANPSAAESYELVFLSLLANMFALTLAIMAIVLTTNETNLKTPLFIVAVISILLSVSVLVRGVTRLRIWPL